MRVRAPNPSPLTLDGTNTYVVGRWVVDPGPGRLPGTSTRCGVLRTDGIEGVVLTHCHADHAEAAPLLGVPVTLPGDGDSVGPFTRSARPATRPTASACCSAASASRATRCWAAAASSSRRARGRCRAYLASLRRLRSLELDVLCPGHGPYVWDPRAKLDEYIAHRLGARGRRSLAALDAGLRTRDELLDAAWPDAPAELRDFAALSLASHLEKLAEEGRLPEGWRACRSCDRRGVEP